MAVTQHVGVGGSHLLERRQCLLRLALLNHAQHGVEDDDGHDCASL